MVYPFLQWKGSHELDCKYWLLYVGLKNNSVSIIPSVRDTVSSKILIEAFDHFALTFMVGCTLLIFAVNDFDLFSTCSHNKNMSPIYLHNKYGFYPHSFIAIL